MDLDGQRRKVYLDNAATTRVADEVISAMLPYFKDDFANPSSIHEEGRRALTAINNARKQIASVIGCVPDEIYFTSGGTESDNWAIKGAARLMKNKGKHIITSKIEHHAVLNSLKTLEEEGYDVTYLDVNESGFVCADDVKNAIRKDTVLISVMYANNETGAIQPVKAIGEIAKKHGILFHTDAVQAFGHIPIDVNDMNIDLLSFSGHKFNAPKGTGGLYIRHGVLLPRMIDGGEQEKEKRSGTENVPAIAGMGTAAEIARAEMRMESARIERLREKLIAGILNSVPDCVRNTPEQNSLPGIANISVKYVTGEALVLMLSLRDICASAGAACTSHCNTPSHVLSAMGFDSARVQGAVRFSLDRYTTDEDIDILLDIFPNIVSQLRTISCL